MKSYRLSAASGLLQSKGAESVNLKNFTYYDRMMPMQDYLPEGKPGNLIALPLFLLHAFTEVRIRHL